MSDFRILNYEAYLSAWSAMAAHERLQLLRGSVIEDVVFKNATKSRTGIADVVLHLEAFQERSPGGSFKLLSMLGWENHAMATWQLVDREGKAGFTGHDVVAYNNSHLIESIVMFSNVPTQTLVS